MRDLFLQLRNLPTPDLQPIKVALIWWCEVKLIITDLQCCRGAIRKASLIATLRWSHPCYSSSSLVSGNILVRLSTTKPSSRASAQPRFYRVKLRSVYSPPLPPPSPPPVTGWWRHSTPCLVPAVVWHAARHSVPPTTRQHRPSLRSHYGPHLRPPSHLIPAGPGRRKNNHSRQQQTVSFRRKKCGGAESVKALLSVFHLPRLGWGTHLSVFHRECRGLLSVQPGMFSGLCFSVTSKLGFRMVGGSENMRSEKCDK